jgi:copper homeostasis protein (lipoprotein)
MQGMFSYMADAAGFEECTTGRRLPVAMEGGYLDLERAYLAAKGKPGRPLMALVEGSIALRPPMEGPSPVPTLVVGKFLRLAPGETCPARFRTARLEDTEWKLIALGEEAVMAPPAGRPGASLLLRGADKRASGSDGCNRFMAGYELEGDRISFSQAASTMMACVDGEEVARRYMQALSTTARWRVLGGQLELYDADGRLLARLQAVETP